MRASGGIVPGHIVRSDSGAADVAAVRVVIDLGYGPIAAVSDNVDSDAGTIAEALIICRIKKVNNALPRGGRKCFAAEGQVEASGIIAGVEHMQFR